MSKQIQWYPGHMFKAKKEIIAQLKTIDLVVEIIDARVPLSSHNEMLEEITQYKPKLIVFSKADLVNPAELKKYKEHYENLGYTTIEANLKNAQGNTKVKKKIQEVSKHITDKYQAKGINKVIRVLVMGMPNVGKSTFINFMLNSKKTKIGNRPGVTRQQQWVRLDRDIELLDTPGILVPKISNEASGFNLVLCSLIKDEVVPKDDVAVYMLNYLVKNHPAVLKSRYGLVIEDVEDIDYEQVYETIARRIGALMRGNEADYERVTNVIINDFRNQKFGNLILDEQLKTTV
ncbi:ribosome biogenesis GTPase YlqF [Mollicutes bacterium LVI A0078]|nr:ribosome biogenesis GTPase YlqF [Mollicutes bacterium LVI A0075]WOO90902.1 ribosome biogenesis GTPase YlqF [Mollicutes bacterium LVI A0078]